MFTSAQHTCLQMKNDENLVLHVHVQVLHTSMHLILWAYSIA